MSATIVVCDQGRSLAFSFADMLAYHGPGSPGGGAHAFQVRGRGPPLLAGEAPPERGELPARTASGGPGARNGFELVPRGGTGARSPLEPELARPERGRALERFVFRLDYRGREVTLAARDGF